MTASAYSCAPVCRPVGSPKQKISRRKAMRVRMRLATLLCMLLLTATVKAQATLDGAVEHELDSLITAYKTLHANPELSGHEEKTAAMLAKELRALGYE